jgi:hypothetical protein
VTTSAKAWPDRRGAGGRSSTPRDSFSASSERIASTADGLAVDVVEDLRRERAAVAGGEDVPGERRQVELTLAGKEPVVAAPLQDVHREPRRVGRLEEDLLPQDRAERRRVVALGEDVEASRQTPSAGCAALRTMRYACS